MAELKDVWCYKDCGSSSATLTKKKKKSALILVAGCGNNQHSTTEGGSLRMWCRTGCSKVADALPHGEQWCVAACVYVCVCVSACFGVSPYLHEA